MWAVILYASFETRFDVTFERSPGSAPVSGGKNPVPNSKRAALRAAIEQGDGRVWDKVGNQPKVQMYEVIE